ncbi:hypothetical protein [Lysinibacillus sp. GbtcB16]|uniref:hypothetical protein n=1 Tax=Lysinibacillus sp. GbtcB16 TaxID=2824761 RepID=UPI001C2F95B5|nr:hypothetical protein [Lysinibacillus sp. GbtcB16]
MNKETREEKFIRIAEKRMSRIFSQMNLIANLSSKKHYSYTENEVKELFQCYEDKGKEIKLFFESSSNIDFPLPTEFSFSNAIEREEKGEKFRKLAESRMSKIFTDMNLIANLSNKKNYSYNSFQINELFQAYEDKGKEIKLFFEPLNDKFTFSNKKNPPKNKNS